MKSVVHLSIDFMSKINQNSRASVISKIFLGLSNLNTVLKSMRSLGNMCVMRTFGIESRNLAGVVTLT